MKSVYDFDSDYDWYDYLDSPDESGREDDPDYSEDRAEREAAKMEYEAWAADSYWPGE